MTVLKHRGKFDLAILLFLIAFPLAISIWPGGRNTGRWSSFR
jgi:hypothetical protein